MQFSVDSAALAAAYKLFTGTPSNTQTLLNDTRDTANEYANKNGFKLNKTSDVIFGYANATDPLFQANTSSNSFSLTGGYNSVKVQVASNASSPNGRVPALFGTILHQNGYDASSSATALYGTNVNGMSGLRPLYVCHGAWDAAVATGNPTSQLITLYNNNLSVGSQNLTVSQTCGDLPPGSFGFTDFNLNSNGAPGASTVRTWWDQGYTGQVLVNQAYTPQPGNQINSYKTELEALIDHQTVVVFPMYKTSSGQGSGAKYIISGFVGFLITDIKTTGPNSGRYIKGYFRKLVCESKCTTGSTSLPNGAIAHLKLIH